MKLPILSTPTYKTTLPSGKKVEFRPFLVKEHKILLTLSGTNDENPDPDSELVELSDTIITLIDACTFNKLKSESLSYFDMVFLFMKIRAKSVGEVVNIKLKCDCGNPVDASYNLEDLKVRKSPTKPNNLVMLDETVGVTLRYPNLKTAIALINNPNTDIIPDCIESIVDGDSVITPDELEEGELVRWLDTLSVAQVQSINEYFKTAPVVVQEIEAKCEHCEKDIHSEITSLYNFFF